LINDTLLGAFAGGIIGFGVAIGRDIVNRRLTSPKITICEESVEAQFDYNSRTSVDKPTKFVGTRIRVRNKGSTAAEDCKASLIMREQDIRVAWHLKLFLE
jgi:hypothetical protein